MSDFQRRGRGDYSSPRGFRGGRGGRGDYSSPRDGSFSSPRGAFSSPRGRGGFSADQNIPMPEMTRHPQLVSQQLARGREGRSIELVANFYKFTTTDVAVFHYDVNINRLKKGSKGAEELSERPSSPTGSSKSTSSGSASEEESNRLERFIRKFSSQIITKMTNTDEAFRGVRYVFDGFKNLYTTKLLDFGGHKSKMFNVTIEVDNRPADFSIKLKMADRVAVNEVLEYYAKRRNDLSERIVSVYEIVFRFIMGKHYETFQRKFFDLKTVQDHPRVQLAEFVQGFTSAVRMTEFGLALNVHLKTSCIISRRIVNLTDLANVVAHIGEGRPTREQIIDFNRFIRHLRMMTKHGKREITYLMDGIVDKAPRDMTFKNREGQMMTIADYFQSEYGITVRQFPLVKTSGRQARYLPMELCFLVPNQFLSNAKINSQIMRELLLKSTNAPNVYFKKLDSIVQKVAASETELQENFGIRLDTRPVTFMGRVLDSPHQLNSNNRDKFYSTKAAPARWAVFCFDTTITEEQLNAFIKSMTDRANFLGITFAAPKAVAITNIQDAGTIHNVFHNLNRLAHAQFVFVGIPTRHQGIAPAQMYSLIKHKCDQIFGIISQCFKADYILNPPVGYFDNFLLKVNGKIGGLNAVIDPQIISRLPFQMKSTMLVGIDVNHPAEVERVCTSVAAAVGSLDPMFSRYSTAVRVQKKERDEILKNLDTMIEELLEEYFAANGYFPTNLIIFRDGVSDGQFEMVKDKEIKSIEKGIKKLCDKRMPNMTFIVTQKRHNTRFALTQLNTQPRKPTWNVPSGTVVDTTIVEPLYKMFYLNSHFSPLGTSRPTKYVILRDDHNMDAEEVQEMCFTACYNSVRTRSVIATPTPVRYADLCAYRAKLHIEAQRNEIIGAIGPLEEAAVEAHIIRRLNGLVNVDPQLKNRLYFC